MTANIKISTAVFSFSDRLPNHHRKTWRNFDCNFQPMSEKKICDRFTDSCLIN
ncbi:MULTISPECIES: hypothetical protein [unclassified Tolypothrix]|uniref:hypothetical protein n=1 Tax=unclassified Tolypothrix TaxID=2649714 RepID=UPI0012D7AD06|nr:MULTISPECIES: hypothetical protein [unclassified Tolypothrix]MBE9084945.1 hypothetical protein [Tolypothrix sp. LEGE 11397]UYD23496.1 hypothetical protein HGR01_18375 [Tolypothrix sp. PCC 7712]UYD34275.1 hypothetical protein HG267_36400 [Tolypothrix sp. PCC 7601]